MEACRRSIRWGLKEEVKVSDEVLVEALMQSVKLLRKSSEEIRKYLEEHKEVSNPAPYENLLLNAILSQNEAISKANETLARILERTRQLEGISSRLENVSRNLWIVIGQTSVIIALMLSILLKLALA